MNIKPIRTEEDYRAALREIEQIFHAEPGTAEGDRLEVLSILVEAYERVHYPVDPLTPADYIKMRMSEMGLRQTDLIKYIGSKARVSEILSGKRNLTVKMIKELHNKLHIPYEVLLS